MAYEFIEHTADVEFKASAATLEKLFVEAAKALNEQIRGDISILEKTRQQIEVKAKDLPGLLYNFLEEFLFLLDSEDFLAAYVKQVTIDEGDCSMSCTIVGDTAKNYTFTNDVKAITLDDLYVRQEKNGTYTCQVVLDV